MKAKYLGLELASPSWSAVPPIRQTCTTSSSASATGAGAVVLKSIFEEQIYRQAASLDNMEGYGDAGEYLERYLATPTRPNC